METVVYVMWTSFLLGFGAGAWRLGAIIVGVLRDPLPAHLTGGGTSRIRNQNSAAASRSPEPDPAWLYVPSLSERSAAVRSEAWSQPEPTPRSQRRHTSVSREPVSPRRSESAASA